MFTGLVETMGRVCELIPAGAGRVLVVREPMLAPELSLGESVAVNGTCPTVIAADSATFRFEVGPETLARTNLGDLKPEHLVNLERSMRLSDRLGGHIVQGHIDGVGEIIRRTPDGEWIFLRFRCNPDLTNQMVTKGSIAIDGVSLTLVEVSDSEFSVALIPHTLAITTLGFKGLGDRVNIETDMLAKYVQKALQLRGESRS